MLSLLAALVAVPSAPSKWSVDFGNGYCQATRSLGAGSVATTLIIRAPLDPQATTRLIFKRDIKALSGDPMKSARIDFNDGSPIYGAELQASLAQDGFQYELDLPSEHAKRLRGTTSFSMKTSAKVGGDYDISPSAPLFRALDRCVADLLGRMGVGASTGPITRPVPNSTLDGLFTSARYWTAEARTAKTNRVTVSLLIDQSGKIRDCAIVAGSGSPTIDRQTCQIFQLRLNYSPAKDGKGKPVATLHRETIEWHR